MKKLILACAIAFLVAAVGIPGLFAPPTLASPVIVSGLHHRMDQGVLQPALVVHEHKPRGNKKFNTARLDKKKAHTAISMMLMLSLSGGAGDS